MRDERKTKAQLIHELKDLRRRVASKCRLGEEHLSKASHLKGRGRVEKELPESEQPYRSIFEASPVSIMTFRNG